MLTAENQYHISAIRDKQCYNASVAKLWSIVIKKERMRGHELSNAHFHFRALFNFSRDFLHQLLILKLHNKLDHRSWAQSSLLDVFCCLCLDLYCQTDIYGNSKATEWLFMLRVIVITEESHRKFKHQKPKGCIVRKQLPPVRRFAEDLSPTVSFPLPSSISFR